MKKIWQIIVMRIRARGDTQGPLTDEREDDEPAIPDWNRERWFRRAERRQPSFL